jgi:hypothetical protein
MRASAVPVVAGGSGFRSVLPLAKVNCLAAGATRARPCLRGAHAVAVGGYTDCAAVLGKGSRRRTHFAHCVRSVQTAAASQFTKRASAPTPFLRSSPPQKSHPAGTACRAADGLRFAQEHKDKGLGARRGENLQPGANPVSLFPRMPPTHPQSSVRTGRRAPLRRRGAELWGRRACALRELTRRGCLNAMSEANGVSSAARPQSEHRSGVGCTRPTAEAKPSGLSARCFAAPTAVCRADLQPVAL